MKFFPFDKIVWPLLAGQLTGVAEVVIAVEVRLPVEVVTPVEALVPVEVVELAEDTEDDATYVLFL